MADHGTGTNNRGNTASVGTSASEIVPAADAGSATLPRTVAVQNVDPANTVYIGFGSDVTTANGWRMSPNEAITLELMYFDSLYAISSGGATDVRILVLNAGNTVI